MLGLLTQTFRRDWATKGRATYAQATVAQPMDTFIISPLLHAAQKGSMESVKWLLSDTPAQLYLEFEKSEAAKSDTRLKHLSQSSGGFEGAVTRWLGVQSEHLPLHLIYKIVLIDSDHLAVHAAIMGPSDVRATKIVKYLIKAQPAYLKAKDIEGKTPLAVAAELGRLNLVKILIAHGADQSIKDKHYNNIVHLALNGSPKASQLRTFLTLLDPKPRPFLLKERSGLDASHGRPAIHRWAGSSPSTCPRSDNELLDELRVLLEFSKDADLLALDGQGDTVLHLLVRERKPPALIREIAETDPRSLFRENVVGVTPAELAHDLYVRSCVEAPPLQQYSSLHGNGAVDGLLNKAPEQYERDSVGGELPRVRQIYDVVNELAALYPGERRLVSLNEANDVAERIGWADRGLRYGWKGVKDERGWRAYKVDAEELRDEEPLEDVATGDFVSNMLPAMLGSAWEEPQVVE